MSLIRPFYYGSNLCFTHIFGLDFVKKTATSNHNDNSTTSTIEFKNREGIRILPYGDTNLTQKNSHCGFDAMCDLLPTDDILELSASYLYSLRIVLEGMGYVHGLTMLGIAYDWRLTYQSNNFNSKFVKSLNDLYDISSKKVTIVAHSMGNLNVYNSLIQLPQSLKDKKISRFISVAPPFLGAVKPFRYSLTVESSLAESYLGTFGLNA